MKTLILRLAICVLPQDKYLRLSTKPNQRKTVEVYDDTTPLRDPLATFYIDSTTDINRIASLIVHSLSYPNQFPTPEACIQLKQSLILDIRKLLKYFSE